MPVHITIEGFESLTNQQMFDMAVAHIAGTRQQSYKDGTCCYSGTGCNAAPFIKPEKRLAADSHGGWSMLVSHGLVSNHAEEFIEDLQDAHDRALRGNFMPEWKERMQSLAWRYDLDQTSINAVEV